MMTSLVLIVLTASAGQLAPRPELDASVQRCAELTFKDLSVAVAECTKTIAEARDLGAVEHEATALAFRASALSWGTDWDGAIRDGEEALRLIGHPSDGLAARQATLILGAAHRERGDAGPALSYSAEAIEKCRRAGDVSRESLAHATRARTMFWLGDFQQARTEADTAIALARRIKGPFEEFYATWQRGMTELAAAQLDEASVFLGQSLRLAEAIAFAPGIIQMHLNLAALNIQRGNLAAVRPALAVARRMINGGGAPAIWVAYVDETEATLLAAEGDPRSAADRFARAARFNPSPWLQTRALVGRARALRDSGRVEDALAAYREAIAAVESVRADTPAEGQRSTYMADNLNAYRELVSMLWERNGAVDAVAAFEIAEAARARALRDALVAAGRSPELSQPTSVAAVQSRLAPGQLFVEYMQTGTHLFVFTLSSSRLSWTALPSAEPRALASRIGFFRHLAQQESTTGPLAPAARQLFDDLVAPALRAAASDTTSLIISPDGILQFLPFDLLVMPSRDGPARDTMLIERYVVEYAPSAAMLVKAPARPDERRILAVSDPHAPFDDARARSAMRGEALRPLVFSRAEADEALRRTGGRGTVLKGVQAKESAVKAAAPGNYAILHFATHAVINEALPQRSALLLGSGDGEDGLLEAGEIYGLAVNADLVVLSACQTGLGQLVGGEGAQSLGRAFLRAGAGRVVSTLWPIDDRGSVALMSAFYRSLAAGIQPAEALTRAKRASMASGMPPRVWAAFVINGRPDDQRAASARAAPPPYLWIVPLLVVVMMIATALGWRRRSA
jgi:CHAT domain-containing protein